MATPKVLPVFTSRPVTPHDARRYGLNVHKAYPDEVVGVVQVEDLWLEALLDDVRWTVAYRIVIQEGRAVVAEVRVFPTEDVNGREPGHWSGEWRGRKATVPTGGLTTRSLRSIRLGHDVHSLSKFVAQIKKKPKLRWLLDPERGWFGAVGVTVQLAVERPRAAISGRGRPAIPHPDLAELAAAYADIVMSGSRKPIRDLAARRSETVSRIRSRIHMARRLGFLDPGTQGNAGGQLMAAARRLLKPTQRGSHGKKTRKR